MRASKHLRNTQAMYAYQCFKGIGQREARTHWELMKEADKRAWDRCAMKMVYLGKLQALIFMQSKTTA
jgi:hypothetical protein